MFNFLKKKGIDTSNTKDSIKLESLASKPENNKNINMMVSALKNAVDNENNYNIGITGSYGSGKSSIIKSYEKNNNKNLLYISLAILNENDNNDTNNNQDISPLESRLEKAIVNQIVHQIDPKYIPQSFLKSKKEKNYALNTGFISVGVLLLILNIPASYNYIAGIINDDFLLNLIKKIRIYLFAGLIGYGMILLYYIIKKINFSSIIKFKSEIYEFEANSNEKTNDNDSYFDKHLDDILYCISQSKCDAIVFEDIDRFNNQEIFIKLKEINNLLNNRHIFGKFNICKKIPFIYAMNDDLFKSNDKTKFFDVVIPVIPYINGDNSAETFDNLFKNKEEIKPDKVVLNILSHYITDMRLLKNIYNEYIIYIATLSDENFKKHDYNQLFSLIVYKNLYPTDYSNLQFRKGYLFSIINSRKAIVKEYKQTLVDDVKKIEEEIKKIENEFLQSKYELDILYSYSNYRPYFPNKPLIQSFKSLSVQIDVYNHEYKERLKTIENKNNKQINILRNQLNELHKNIGKINVSKLSWLIQGVDDINKYIERQKIDNNHLQFIKILLVNDFINEDYWRYLSYFHQGNASDKDKNFINSVYAKEQPKYDEELDNIEWITSKINPETLDNNFAVLNYSLLYYLLKNNKNYELNKLYIKILELMENYQDEKKYIFIIGFYKYCLDKELIKKKDLLNDLYKHKPEFVSDIFLYKTSVAADKYAVIYYSIIKNSNIIEIDNIYYNEDESIKKEISEYISTHSDIFINDYIIKDAYCNYLKNFNIKFQNISCIDKKNLEAGILERFLRCIFQEDLYKVNENNINYLVNNYLKLKENEPVQDKSNYEIYLHNLYYKTDALHEFIKILNLNTDDSIKFSYSEDIEKLIINNENVSIDDVITFLEKYEIIIDDISNVREDLWYNLIVNSLIKHTWENIIIFYNKFKDNKAEISKVEAVIKEFLLENKMLDKLDTNSNTALFNLIIKDEIETEKFFNIIQNFEQSDNIPTDIPININNMKALLQNKIFAPTKENFDICYNKYRDAFHYFILNNIQLYIENINSYIISKEQLEYIVNVNSIDIDTLFIIVYHYFSNNSYASYRDIKINNTALLEKIFTSELDNTIKIAVFKNNIDVITKTDSLLLYSLSHLLDNNLYNRIKKLFNQNYKSIRLSQEQFNGSNDILNLLIEKNILVKKEHSQHIELSISDDALELFQKK